MQHWRVRSIENVSRNHFLKISFYLGCVHECFNSSPPSPTKSIRSNGSRKTQSPRTSPTKSIRSNGSRKTQSPLSSPGTSPNRKSPSRPRRTSSSPTQEDFPSEVTMPLQSTRRVRSPPSHGPGELTAIQKNFLIFFSSAGRAPKRASTMPTSTNKLKPRVSEVASLIPMDPSLGLTKVNGLCRSLRIAAVNKKAAAGSTASTRPKFPATMRKDVPRTKKKKISKAAQKTPISLVQPTPASVVKRKAKPGKRSTSAKRSKKTTRARSATPAACREAPAAAPVASRRRRSRETQAAAPVASRRSRSREAPATAPVPSRRRAASKKKSAGKKTSAKKPVKRLQGKRRRVC